MSKKLTKNPYGQSNFTVNPESTELTLGCIIWSCKIIKGRLRIETVCSQTKSPKLAFVKQKNLFNFGGKSKSIFFSSRDSAHLDDKGSCHTETYHVRVLHNATYT